MESALDVIYQWSTYLWPWAMGILTVMVLIRLALFLVPLGVVLRETWSNRTDRAGFKTLARKDSTPYRTLASIVNACRSFLPGHAYLGARPFYVLHRAAFHLAMAVSVFFLGYHIYAWEDSLPFWVLFFLPKAELPDAWIEYAALFVIFSTLWLAAARWFDKSRGRRTIPLDMLLYLAVLAPFASGYCLMTGLETSIGWIDDNMPALHLFSGTLFILTAGFLLCRTRIDPDRCVGCLACVQNCPTGALWIQEADGRVSLLYTARLCVHCGTCLRVCDDRASALRHTLALPLPARVRALCSLELAACKECHQWFASLKHLEKLRAKGMEHDIGLCPECRGLMHADTHRALLPNRGNPTFPA